MSVNYVEKYDMIPVEKLGDLMSTEVEAHTPTRGRPYNFYSMQRRNTDFGEFYFSENTMKFFGSRVNTILRTGVFVEGVNPPYSPREYRVMWISPCGSVTRLTEAAFLTMRTADKVAYAFSREIEKAGILPREYMSCAV